MKSLGLLHGLLFLQNIDIQHSQGSGIRPFNNEEHSANNHINVKRKEELVGSVVLEV